MYEILYRERQVLVKTNYWKSKPDVLLTGLSIASSYIQLSGSCKNALYELYIVSLSIQVSSFLYV